MSRFVDISGQYERHMNRTAWVIVAGAAIITIAMGVRGTFGIFMLPLSSEHGVSITVLSFSLALQNLVWGIVQPVAAALVRRGLRLRFRARHLYPLDICVLVGPNSRHARVVGVHPGGIARIARAARLSHGATHLA